MGSQTSSRIDTLIKSPPAPRMSSSFFKISVTSLENLCKTNSKLHGKMLFTSLRHMGYFIFNIVLFLQKMRRCRILCILAQSQPTVSVVIASLLSWAVIVVLRGMLSLKRLCKECVTKGVKLFFRISDGKRTLRISSLKFKFKI